MFWRKVSDYGFWSICWFCKYREQEYRLLENDNGYRLCNECFEAFSRGENNEIESLCSN